MNKLYVILIFIICIPFVFGMNIVRDEETVLNNFKCYDFVKIKVLQKDYNITDNYKFVNCSREAVDLWNCSCVDDKLNLTFISFGDNKNVYDLSIQYYTNHIKKIPINYTPDIKGAPSEEQLYNDKNKVLLNINNIVIVDKVKDVVTIQKFSELFGVGNTKMLVVIFMVFILLCGVGVYYMYKKLFGDDPKNKKPMNIDSDKELQDIIRKYQ